MLTVFVVYFVYIFSQRGDVTRHDLYLEMMSFPHTIVLVRVPLCHYAHIRKIVIVTIVF